MFLIFVKVTCAEYLCVTTEINARLETKEFEMKK